MGGFCFLNYPPYICTIINHHFKTKKMSEVEKAKEVLRAHGYFVDNLWHNDDVQSLHKRASAEDAQRILNTALTNQATMEQIWYAITDALEFEQGYVPLSDEDED